MGSDKQAEIEWKRSKVGNDMKLKQQSKNIRANTSTLNSFEAL
jgi:hypothetical protein